MEAWVPTLLLLRDYEIPTFDLFVFVISPRLCHTSLYIDELLLSPFLIFCLLVRNFFLPTIGFHLPLEQRLIMLVNLVIREIFGREG